MPLHPKGGRHWPPPSSPHPGHLLLTVDECAHRLGNIWPSNPAKKTNSWQEEQITLTWKKLKEVNKFTYICRRNRSGHQSLNGESTACLQHQHRNLLLFFTRKKLWTFNSNVRWYCCIHLNHGMPTPCCPDSCRSLSRAGYGTSWRWMGREKQQHRPASSSKPRSHHTRDCKDKVEVDRAHPKKTRKHPLTSSGLESTRREKGQVTKGDVETFSPWKKRSQLRPHGTQSRWRHRIKCDRPHAPAGVKRHRSSKSSPQSPLLIDRFSSLRPPWCARIAAIFEDKRGSLRFVVPSRRYLWAIFRTAANFQAEANGRFI